MPTLVDTICNQLYELKNKDSDRETVLELQITPEHVYDILESGDDAFRKRETKYGFTII